VKTPMPFEECINNHLKKVVKDENQINSLLKISNARVKAIKQININDETASIVLEGYYEAIKELLSAYLLKQGLKSDNHECLIAVFRNKFPNYDYESDFIYNIKELRNKINYNGLFIKKSYLNRNLLEINHILKLLKKEIQNS